MTQGLVAAALAAVLIRISLTGEYLRFVQPWMRWPLLATGLALLLMALRPASGYAPKESWVPATSWLLLLPTLIVFSVVPPPLGAYIAERRPAQTPVLDKAPDRLPVATNGNPVNLGVDEFTWGAAEPGDPMGLKGQAVRLEGFVSTDEEGGWYLTALVIFCCAADVVVERVKITGRHRLAISGFASPEPGSRAPEPAPAIRQRCRPARSSRSRPRRTRTADRNLSFSGHGPAQCQWRCPSGATAWALRSRKYPMPRHTR